MYIDEAHTALDIFRFAAFFMITLFRRLCTLRQLVLLFNYHIIHAVNSDDKNSSKRKVFKMGEKVRDS